MSEKNQQTHLKPIKPFIPIGIGAGIGLILIALFLSGINDPNPDWPQYWYLRPLIVVPIAGAMGGLAFYILDFLSIRGYLNKTLAVILSLFIYVIGLWLGSVFGLVGTLWD